MVKLRVNADQIREHAPLEDAFPDIGRTKIHKDLLEWGIDTGDMYIEFHPGLLSVMGALPMYEGIVAINPSVLEWAYPMPEGKYLGLIHELTHLLQAIERGTKVPKPSEWIHSQTEQEAVMRSVTELLVLRVPKERIRAAVRIRYSGNPDLPTILSIMESAITRHERGVSTPARRPEIHVRQHKRRI